MSSTTSSPEMDGIPENDEYQRVRPVGESTVAVITKIRNEIGEAKTGNILRRVCEIGGAACADVCQLRAGDWSDDTPLNIYNDETCADGNLIDAVERLGADPERLLMVAAIADNVGFGDNMPEYDVQANQGGYGYQELKGYNAFFARPSEVGLIGTRMGDCGFICMEFKDAEGHDVFGFQHSTRTNMKGETALGDFEIDGEPVSYSEHVLHEAITHYGADPASFKINVTSALTAQNYEFNFPNEEAMKKYFPGWIEEGLITHRDDPDRTPDESMTAEDTWNPDYRKILIGDLVKACERAGVPLENLDISDILDQAGSGGVHSSNTKQARAGKNNDRDLYLVGPKEVFQS